MSSQPPSTRSNVDDITIVWLDDNEHTEDSIPTELDRATSALRIFSDAERGKDYIRQAVNENILLVMSSSFFPSMVSQVHDLSQLKSIYVVGTSSPSVLDEHHSVYTKVRGYFQDIAALGEYLTQDIRMTEAVTTPMSIVSSNTTLPESLDTLDPSFMYSQLLKEILFEFNDDEEARRRFVEFSREHYAADRRQLNVVNEFEHHYRDHSPAWWYTRECFLYRMLNKALRDLDIDSLCRMGFFIRDLNRQLEQLQSAAVMNAPIVLYRGQGSVQQINTRFRAMPIFQNVQRRVQETKKERWQSSLV